MQAEIPPRSRQTRRNSSPRACTSSSASFVIPPFLLRVTEYRARGTSSPFPYSAVCVCVSGGGGIGDNSSSGLSLSRNTGSEERDCAENFQDPDERRKKLSSLRLRKTLRRVAVNGVRSMQRWDRGGRGGGGDEGAAVKMAPVERTGITHGLLRTATTWR